MRRRNTVKKNPASVFVRTVIFCNPNIVYPLLLASLLTEDRRASDVDVDVVSPGDRAPPETERCSDGFQTDALAALQRWICAEYNPQKKSQLLHQDYYGKILKA